MKKKDFLKTLRHIAKYSQGQRNAPCRCADCYNERQNRQDKTADTSEK